MQNKNEEYEEDEDIDEDELDKNLEALDNDDDDSDAEDSDDDEPVTLSKAEFKRLDRKARAYDAKKPEKTKKITKPQDDTTKTTISPERFERMELRQEGYTKEEVDMIMELGGARVAQSKLVQRSIESMRREAKRKEAEVPGGTRSPVFQKHTEADLSKMSRAELRKILPKA